MKKFSLYLIRWQLSTPILYIVLRYLNTIEAEYAVIIANLVGGCVFYWVDKYIFK